MSAPLPLYRIVPLELCPGSYVWAGTVTTAETAACPSCGGRFVPGIFGPESDGPRRSVQVPAHEDPRPQGAPAADTTDRGGPAEDNPPQRCLHGRTAYEYCMECMVDETADAAQDLGFTPRPIP